MSQKVQVILVDDLDGGDAEQTVQFSFDGVSYEIDLSAKNANKFADVIAPYVGVARRVGSARGRRRSTAAKPTGSSPAEIREWARAEGYEVSERGRINAELRALYESSHA